MTPTEKAKRINLEVMQDSIRDARNKSIGNDAVCSTAAGTAAKTVTLGTTFELVTKATIIVKFENAITVAGATLNITHTDLAGQTSSTGAKDIYYRGAALPANLVKAGMSLIMRYNGTQWDIISNIEALDDYLQVNAQNFSNAQKLQARTNIGAQENVTDMAKLGCGIGTCSTDSGTALVVSLTDYELVKNGHVSVNFEHDVPADATLNINSKGAKPIIYKGSAIEADVIKADDTALFSYNGTNYVLISSGGNAAPANPNETVNISLTQIGGSSADLIGAAITITDDDSGDTLLTATWNGSTITTEIDVNTNYTVSVDTISGYLSCSNQSYTAIYQNKRNVLFQYVAINGAYVEATDGTLYKSSAWALAGKTANSIVVLTNACKVRMALTGVALPIHTRYSDPIENYMTTKDQASAKVDYDGEGNTNKIIQFNAAYGTNTSSYAAPYCKAYTFTYPSGQKGCLSSFGQVWTLYQNKTEVDACLDACGGTAISTSTYIFSSDFWGPVGTDRYFWILNWSDGSITYGHPNDSLQVRPVSAYE